MFNRLYYFFLFWFVCGFILLGFNLLPPSLEWANAVFLALSGLLGSVYFVQTYGKIPGMMISIFIFIVSFIVEYFGASRDFLFGSYDYTAKFAPTLMNVPLAIGFAWLMVIATSDALAQTFAPKRKFIYFCVASSLPVLLDLVLDPVSFIAKKYWLWQEGGLYYNIPLSNFTGWWLLSLFLLLFLRFFPIQKEDTQPLWQKRMHYVYILITLMFSYIALLSGLLLAGTIGCATVLSVLWLLHLKKERKEYEVSKKMVRF
ncbi:MAG: carotenoid biosynthesis protein [Bacilli bacterium]